MTTPRIRLETVIVGDGSVLIPLGPRQAPPVAFARVDADDAVWLSRWNWTLHPRGYAAARDGDVKLLMHRHVLGLPNGTRGTAGHVEVDHIDGDRLNNRRGNLRAVTRAENAQNIERGGGKYSPHRNVYYDKIRGRWYVRLKVGGIHYTGGGYFTTPEEAAATAERLRAAHAPFSVPARTVRSAG